VRAPATRVRCSASLRAGDVTHRALVLACAAGARAQRCARVAAPRGCEARTRGALARTTPARCWLPHAMRAAGDASSGPACVSPDASTALRCARFFVAAPFSVCGGCQQGDNDQAVSGGSRWPPDSRGRLRCTRWACHRRRRTTTSFAEHTRLWRFSTTRTYECLRGLRAPAVSPALTGPACAAEKRRQRSKHRQVPQHRRGVRARFSGGGCGGGGAGGV
jgi:hypothetical protein